jgi:hypothetical protein
MSELENSRKTEDPALLHRQSDAGSRDARLIHRGNDNPMFGNAFRLLLDETVRDHDSSASQERRGDAKTLIKPRESSTGFARAN